MQKQREREDDATLDDDVATDRSVIDQNGSITVVMPKDAARELGIEPGGRVLWRGREGDDALEAVPYDAEQLLAD